MAATVPPDVKSVAYEIQGRLLRIAEMARVIDRASDDLPLDCHKDLFRICAEIIRETADLATDEAECIATGVA